MEQEKLNKTNTLAELASFAMENIKINTMQSDLCDVINRAFLIGRNYEHVHSPAGNPNKWHSISECLPKEGQRVGIVTRDGAMYFGCMFNGSFPKNVTHWLDIPDIPK